MALKITRISIIVESEKKGAAPDVIHIDAEKKKLSDDEGYFTGEEKWKVKLNPRYGGDMKFDLTGDELDGVLDDLVSFRGLIRKIEGILGDAEKGGA
jgi:hypothetical protein